PWIARPWNQRRRQKTGWRGRSWISRQVNRRRCESALAQSYHDTSLSWQYAVLLPRWVRPISSPPRIIGTPCDKSSVVRKFRPCRERGGRIALSVVGPSAPQFHERL